MALQELLQVDRDCFQKREFIDDDQYDTEANDACLNAGPLFDAPISKGLKVIDGNTGKHISVDFKKGTTTMSFKYKNGIVVCCDSRATGGDFIYSKTVHKIIPINKNLIGTMAGGAADCSYWLRVMSVRCRMYELRNKEKISVAAASKMLANILYQYKGSGISMGTMIVGHDKKGPGLYWVDNDGGRYSGDSFSVGSGSPYAYGVLDTHWKYDMTDEEACELGRRAILHATHRDGASGGIIRVYLMKEDGWKKISFEDSSDLYYKYQERRKEEKMVD
ncbi:proteasome beta5 subunit [Brevipalpus obovatus]|uniref:proteasome beta5 subunit n=1 Tax=Brevipalpus obovatus TaxID=246614 RepID=UPI003D9EE1C2